MPPDHRAGECPHAYAIDTGGPSLAVSAKWAITPAWSPRAPPIEPQTQPGVPYWGPTADPVTEPNGRVAEPTAQMLAPPTPTTVLLRVPTVRLSCPAASFTPITSLVCLRCGEPESCELTAGHHRSAVPTAFPAVRVSEPPLPESEDVTVSTPPLSRPKA